MSVINTNVNAIIAQNAGVKNERLQTTAMQRLSTGQRINTASDDAAGLAISTKMTSQIRGLNQAVRNANDGISLIQTAEGALTEVTNMLQRMRELAVQSASDTNTSSDRTALNAEFVALRDEINRIGNNTQFNGMNVLDGSFDGGNGVGKYVFQVGANGGQTIDITMADYRTTGAASTGSVTAATTTAAAAAVDAQQAVSASAVVEQVSTLTFADLSTGEIVYISDGTNTYTYTATGATTAGTIAADFKTDFAGWGYSAAATATAGVVTVTGNSDGTTFTFSTSYPATGTATAGTETAGTASTRESNTLALSGTYAEGDVLTFTVGSTTATYTVVAADVGDIATMVDNIAVALDGYITGTTIDSDGANTLTFTNDDFGAGTLGDLSMSQQVGSYSGTATFATTTYGVSEQDAVDAVAATTQASTVTISGSFNVGDVLNVTAGSNTISYEVTAYDVESTNQANTIASNIGLALFEAGVTESVSIADNVISLTASSAGTAGAFTASAGVTSRVSTGSADLSMIDSSDINTQTSANTAVGSIDSAISVVSGGRATMGATINRLNYAADNLMTTSANASASRSRILDTDYSAETTELARTQIIQQASTAMLAQANQSAQSVLSLLK